ncbi:MAG: hypothetical protein ACE15B_01965 [Bryobacteraceae bacterium]
MPTKIKPVAPGGCKPFVLQVMVMSPQAGFKFELLVEKSCTADNQALFKLVFDLYKEIEGEFVQVVHVSYTPGPAETQQIRGIKQTIRNGVNGAQAEIATAKLAPKVITIANSGQTTPEDEKEVNGHMAAIAAAGMPAVVAAPGA